MAQNKKLSDKQAERRARLIMFIVGLAAFVLGVALKMLAKNNAIAWPEALTTVVEIVAWPFWIGGFVLVLLGLGMMTKDDK